MHSDIVIALRRYQDALLREFEPANRLADGQRLVVLQTQNAALRLRIAQLEAQLSHNPGTFSTVSLQTTDNK